MCQPKEAYQGKESGKGTKSKAKHKVIYNNQN